MACTRTTDIDLSAVAVGATVSGSPLGWDMKGSCMVHHPTMAMPTSQRIPSHSLAGERLVFTVGEAGELLGISRAFAYELVARGELPVIRLGRRIVVPKAALLAMVALDAAS